MDGEERRYIDHAVHEEHEARVQAERDLAVERDRRYIEMFRSLERAAEDRFTAFERSLLQRFQSLESDATERDLRYQQRFDAAQTALSAAMAAQEKAVQAALEAADRAVSKAEAATERRFESVNEFRGSLNDMAATLMSRSEATVAFGALSEKVSKLENAQAGWTGRDKGLGISWGVLLGAVGAITTVIALLALVAKGVV